MPVYFDWSNVLFKPSSHLTGLVSLPTPTINIQNISLHQSNLKANTACDWTPVTYWMLGIRSPLFPYARTLMTCWSKFAVWGKHSGTERQPITPFSFGNFSGTGMRQIIVRSGVTSTTGESQTIYTLTAQRLTLVFILIQWINYFAVYNNELRTVLGTANEQETLQRLLFLPNQ
jgi:hypothetical protein